MALHIFTSGIPCAEPSDSGPEVSTMIAGGAANPKVSVIIPTYNHANYLGEAIRSVLNQTFRDFEIIVVDDGSTDCTPSLAQQFGRLIHYVRQENRGLSGARNTGIRQARGQYIALLDADDFWEPEFLSTVVPRMEADPGLAAVHTGFKFVDKHGKPLPQYSTMTVPDDRMYDQLVDAEFFAPSTVLVRRHCFEQVGLFDETLRAAEDWDMWLRVSRSFRFGGIPNLLLNYRVHGENMSGDPAVMLRNELKVVEKHFGAADGPYSCWPRDRRRSYATVYRQAAIAYLLSGDVEKGQHYLWQALEAYPSLTQSLSLFWELGCADQPPGRRGDLANLNLERNAEVLLSSLKVIFSQGDLSPRLRPRQNTAYAYAYLALGILAYGSRRMPLARTYLLHALVLSPRLARNGRLLPTLGKASLGKRVVDVVSSYMSALKGLSARRTRRQPQRGSGVRL